MKDKSIVCRNRAAIAITILACSAMIGDVINSLTLKGLGAAFSFAPFPKVFCDNQGLEGFASQFTILAQMPDGATQKIPLTPEMYAKMRGPYNRRNVYGAALSFGPKLPEPMWRSVFDYGLGDANRLATEFGLPRAATNFIVIIETRTSGRTNAWELSTR
ncbi:MAG TPA: hypothetical protein VM680_07945 [Verrucomicrobiae bacterium]|nr:hypothetical protein [Verrucomicrobiae bacterium]